MKKLFAFLVLLGGALSSWAYDASSSHNGELVTVTSATPTELSTIFSVYSSAKLIDFSQAQGVVGDDFITEQYGQKTVYFPYTTQFCILPSKPSDINLGFLMSGNDNWRSHFGYYDSSNTNLLNVYTTNTASLVPLSYVLGESNTLSFLLKLDVNGQIGEYPYFNVDGNLFSNLQKIPVASIDFTWCNVSNYTDFSGLNENTHYITIPVQGNFDFADENTPYLGNDNAYHYYKYGNEPDDDEHIYVVSTYKNSGSPYATTCIFKGKTLVATEGTVISYVRKAGEYANATQYFSPQMKEATRQCFCGTLYATDFIAQGGINSLSATKFDFEKVTESDAAFASFASNSAHYVALPASAANTIKGKENSCDYSTNCPYLYCVGALNTETHKYTTWSKPNLNSGVQVPSVYQVSLMYPASEISAITDVDMSGYLCRNDITVGVDDAVDNRSEIVSVIGLSGANAIETADFGDAVFMPNSDMRFVGIYSEGRAGWSGTALTSITFPTSESQEEIPSYCLVGGSDSQPIEIHIPSNYKTIGDYAFYGRYATKITTTKIDSNGDEIEVDNGDFTISLPASLESIGTGAFVLNHELITDVYVLAKNAPTCAPDAFNTGAYCGYGGFAGNYAHPISRDTYINNGTRFAILHFPSDVEENEAKKYTDITREYSLMDETGAYDGEGKLKAWPNFSEIYRAYHQAVDGAIWKTDGWDTTRGTGWTTDEQGNTSSNGRNFNDIASWPATYLDANGNEVSVTNLYDASTMMSSATVTPGNAYDTRYMGWHQFVLADYYRYTTPTPPAAGAKYVDAGWYTLCIPYDLTEAQVINLIGAPASGTYKGNAPSTNSAGDHFPVVYALKTVTRQDPTVTLGFSQELMGMINNGKDLQFNDDGTNNGTISIEDYNYVAPSGKTEKIYIKGGYSYLVRPIVPEGTTIGNNLGQWMLKNSSFTKSELGNRLELGNDNSVAIPIQKHKVIATDPEGNKLTYIDDNNVEQPYYYYFQGTYTTEKMPTAYFLTDLWYRQTEPDVRNWDNYTAIIAGKSTANGATPVTKTPAEFTAAKDLTTYFIKMVCGRDHFHWKGGNVKIKVTFEDENGFDQALAIDQIDGKDLNTVTEGTVYNMAGQKVGSSLNGLAKGLYIVNGKKVMVK